MPQLVEIDDFYEAGKKLAKHFANSKGKDISIATLQALIRDFLPQHRELQEALRSIVARPEFLQLMLVGSKIGLAQKCAFVENLKKIYSTETAIAADKLACGMMGLAITIIQSESEAQKIVVDTLTQQRNASGVEIEQQEDLPSEEDTLQGNSIEIAENLSPASPSDSLSFTELDWTVSLALVLVATFVAINWSGLLYSPYHVRAGSPWRMPNDSGISNELLAKVIVANAIRQNNLDVECSGYGGYEASKKSYHRYLEKEIKRYHRIRNNRIRSKTFRLLLNSASETIGRMSWSDSCQIYNSNKTVEKVKEWLL